MSKAILEHREKAQIGNLITDLRLSNKSYRDIESSIMEKYQIKVSHTAIKLYWEKQLNGTVIDKMKQGELVVSSDEIVLPSFDIDAFKQEQSKIDEFGTIGELYAQIIGLALGNVKAHKEKGERLRVDYIKQLKELKPLLELGEAKEINESNQ